MIELSHNWETHHTGQFCMPEFSHGKRSLQTKNTHILDSYCEQEQNSYFVKATKI